MSTFADAPASVDTAKLGTWRSYIAKLPITMQPALNQQVDGWENLFPYEQKRSARFLNALSSVGSVELSALARSLRELEQKMGVPHWNFSTAHDTMSNASQLARSPHYLEWRREVQRLFSAIDSRSPSAAEPEASAGRLMVLVLPENLPITSIAGHKPWDSRAVEYRVEGDVRRIDLALSSIVATHSDGASDSDASDCWLIDADAHLGTLLSSTKKEPVSLLQYASLKPFKDEFLQQVNTVPKDIQGTDEILARMRQQEWSQWWPESLSGQKRLRSFVVELFLSGNGALIFSNSFVQWAASEAIRRARPRLLIARFGMRSKPKPFTGIAIFENQQKISALHDIDDPEGSAADSLMLARYTWLSAQRYPEAQQTSCICIGEASRSVYLIALDEKRPAWAAGSAITPEQIHDWMRSCLG